MFTGFTALAKFIPLQYKGSWAGQNFNLKEELHCIIIVH